MELATGVAEVASPFEPVSTVCVAEPFKVALAPSPAATAVKATAMPEPSAFPYGSSTVTTRGAPKSDPAGATWLFPLVTTICEAGAAVMEYESLAVAEVSDDVDSSMT